MGSLVIEVPILLIRTLDSEAFEVPMLSIRALDARAFEMPILLYISLHGVLRH